MWEKSLNFIVSTLLSILLMITLLGTSSDLLFNIGNSSKNSVIILNVCCIILLAFILFRNRLRKFYKKIILPNSAKIVTIFVIFICFWQTYLIITISGFSKWDPGNIILQAMNKNQWAGKDYFSYYPNTYFLMLIEHLIWLIFGKPRIEILSIILNTVNYLLIDSGIYILYRMCMKYFNLTVAKIAAFLAIFFIGLSPWGCFNYSDPLAFSLSIFSLYILLEVWFSNKRRIYYSILLGFLIVVDYLIKPSLVIVFIAAIIVCVPSIKQIIKNKKIIFSTILAVGVAIISLSIYTTYRNNNNFVKFDSNKSFSMAHFANMGIKNNGAYSQEITVRDMKIANPKERNKADIKDWITEFNKKGITGYEIFLVKKQVLNTADTSFAWGSDGTPFIRPYNNSSFTEISHKLFLPKYHIILKIFYDMLWILTILFLFFSFKEVNFITLLLKYTVLGFLLFLLLFEGGRSRYMIQCLPYVFILSGVGFYQLKAIIQIIWRNSINDI